MIPQRRILLAFVLSVNFTAALAAQPSISDDADALIAPVFMAYDRVDELIALLPKSGDVTEELIRMRSIDRTGRDAWEFIDLTGLPEEQRKAAYDAVWDEIARRDLENQARLKELMPENGWFNISTYGIEGALAAFQIVQHAANDPAFQHRALAAMELLLGTDELDSRAYASLYDRLAMEDGRYQRYGSQMICTDHQWALYPAENPDGIDQRRRDAGFDLSLTENIARFTARPPCPDNYDGLLPG